MTDNFSYADVLKSNRLLVVVTRFDEFYMAAEDNERLSEDVIKSKLCASVEKATGSTALSKENIIHICGQWAYIAKQLACDPHNKGLQKKARKCLLQYGKMQIGDITGDELAKVLEKASNVALVEERYN